MVQEGPGEKCWPPSLVIQSYLSDTNAEPGIWKIGGETVIKREQIGRLSAAQNTKRKDNSNKKKERKKR